MSILWMDGFDDYDYDAAASTGAVAGEYEVSADPGSTADITVQATGRRSSGALVITQNSSTAVYAGKTFPSALTEVFFSFAIKASALLASLPICTLYSAATAQVSLIVTSTGAIQAFRGTTAGTSIGTSTAGIVSTTGFSHIQVRIVISDTVGVVQIRVNGSTSPDLNLTAQDTNNGAAAVSVDSIKLGNFGNTTVSGGPASLTFDDFLIWDTTGSIANTWLGDTRVDSYVPTGDGATSNFTTSSGSTHYTLVDEASPDATDYVQSSTVNDIDLYTITGMAHTPSNIFAVMPTVAALKDDAGNRSIRLLAKSGSTTSDNGADLALSTSRARYKGVFETDPNTSAAWTKAAVNAASYGVKVTV